MAGLNTGDIVEVTMIGSLFGQTIRNVFHYRILNESTAVTYVQAAFAFAADFDAGTDSPGLAILSASAPEYRWKTTRVQRLFPQRDTYVETTVDLPGTSTTCTTSNLAAVITKRGALGNRANIGSVHIAAPPAAGQIDGTWYSTYLTKLQAVAACMTTLYTVPLETMDARMVIYHRKNPELSAQVEFTQPRDTVRVMRRRTLRVGE
jgi:hypothetical protein